MTLRTKSEQKAYLDGFEMCAECIEGYLSDKGKKVLESLLISIRNAVEFEDITEPKREWRILYLFVKYYSTEWDGKIS